MGKLKSVVAVRHYECKECPKPFNVVCLRDYTSQAYVPLGEGFGICTETALILVCVAGPSCCCGSSFKLQPWAAKSHGWDVCWCTKLQAAPSGHRLGMKLVLRCQIRSFALPLMNVWSKCLAVWFMKSTGQRCQNLILIFELCVQCCLLSSSC